MGDAAHDFVRTAAPLYRDVAAALERRIRSGAWKPGDQIPTEAQLEREFGSSRGTLRMAISELVRQGLLHPQPGRGTFVLGPSFKSLERFFRYESRGSAARWGLHHHRRRIPACRSRGDDGSTPAAHRAAKRRHPAGADRAHLREPAGRIPQRRRAGRPVPVPRAARMMPHRSSNRRP